MRQIAPISILDTLGHQLRRSSQLYIDIAASANAPVLMTPPSAMAREAASIAVVLAESNRAAEQ